jgi:hypothetical protein
VHYPDRDIDPAAWPSGIPEVRDHVRAQLPEPAQPLHVTTPACGCAPTISWLRGGRLWSAPVLPDGVVAWPDATCGPRRRDDLPEQVSARWTLLSSAFTAHHIDHARLPHQGQPLVLAPHDGGVLWLDDSVERLMYAPANDDGLITWSAIAEHQAWYLNVDQGVATSTLLAAASHESVAVLLPAHQSDGPRIHRLCGLTVHSRSSFPLRVDYTPGLRIPSDAVRSAALCLLRPLLTAADAANNTVSVRLPEADVVTADMRLWRPLAGLEVAFEAPFTITLRGCGTAELAPDEAHRLVAALMAAATLHEQCDRLARAQFARTQSNYALMQQIRTSQHLSTVDLH